MRTPRILLSALLALPLLLSVNAVAQDDYAVMKTNLGTIVLELDRAKAPISVENFETYAKDGYYNGTVFHRVISGFMIQGGGFDFHGVYPAGLHQKPGAREPIKNEWQNGLKNVRGSIAMARTNEPDSATSQFFINTVDNAFLDQPRGGAAYAVFGKVIGGMDAVDRIRNLPTGQIAGMRDVPTQEALIESVTMVSKSKAYEAVVASAEAQVAKIESELAKAKKAVEEAKAKAKSAG